MDTPAPENPTAPGMRSGPAPTSVKKAVASIRLAISAGNWVAAQRDAEHLLATVDAGDRALVLCKARQRLSFATATRIHSISTHR